MLDVMASTIKKNKAGEWESAHLNRMVKDSLGMEVTCDRTEVTE